MIILRSLLFYAICTITVLMFGWFVLIFRLISPRLANIIPVQWTKFATFLAKWICGIEWRVSRETSQMDMETQSFIYLSKHQSTWETFFLYWFLPNTTWVAKKELARIPVFGWAMVAAGLILIDRKDGRRAFEQLTDQSRPIVAANGSVLLFPEGTRQKDLNRKSNYKTGGVRLASALDIPIVPISHNAGYVWPANSLWLRPGIVDVVIGAPIQPNSGSSDALTTQVADFIESNVRKPRSALSGQW